MIYLTICFGIFASFFALALIRSLLHCLSAGAILVDAGTNPARGRNLPVGLTCLFIGIGGSVAMLQEFDLLYLSLTLAGAVGAVAAVANSVGRLQVCENGLWLFSDLIAWDKILSHHWDGAEQATLNLEIRTLPFLKSRSTPFPPLAVPVQFKSAFAEALEKHVPATKISAAK
jgi:hypothetical protein